MQEPILKRWGTVGEASCYLDDFGDVADAFCKGLCASESTKTSHSVHQGASNFRSLYAEVEIRLDNAFLADFDRLFFRQHLEFNHSTDPCMGKSGFQARNHLVRYFLKDQDLTVIEREIEAGIASADGSTAPPNAVLRKFWSQLNKMQGATREIKDVVLNKASIFLKEYRQNMVKHHAQWTSPMLLFLGAFSDIPTGQIVGRHLLGQEDVEVVSKGQYYEKSATTNVHGRKIDRFAFATWLKTVCPKVAVDKAVQNENFQFAEEAIKDMCGGLDIWHNSSSPLALANKQMYMEHFSALSSTMELVERAVKKAKLCQKTPGKGERAVTAYGIAGDGTSERCLYQYVQSTYPEEMTTKRQAAEQTAEDEGRSTWFKGDFTLDIERGPGLTTYHQYSQSCS